MKKKIVILGASGFIGRNLTEFFSKKKEYNVYGTYLSRKPKIKNVKLKKINLLDQKKTEGFLKNKNIVINCAAITSGAKDIVSKPYIHVSDNTVINSNIISSCFKNKINHLILMSCTLMYKSSKKKLREKDFNFNDEIYPKYFGGAWMKIYMEKMAQFFNSLGNIKTTVIRHSNIYGPFDKFDLKKSHVFGATINKVVSAKQNIKVLGKGSEKRDFLYIDDLVRFIFLVLKRQKKNFRIYNCGCGEYITVKNLVKKIIKINGKKIKILFDKKFKSLNTYVKLDTNLAKRELKWEPQVSIDTGIKKTINWYKSKSDK